MPASDTYQHLVLRRLERVLIAFFLLATLFLLAVYIADPSIYTKTLMFQPSPTDRYPFQATLFLVGILVFIAVLIVGVLQHWRWLFWLLLIAFGFSILGIPAAILHIEDPLSEFSRLSMNERASH
jgi:tellurite resistance protein TehA-like permease